MAIRHRIERTYRVRFDEAGPDGMLRTSGFLRYAQDLAWLHSESAGFGRGWYRGRGLTWLVRAIELSLLEDVHFNSELAVTTEVTGFRRVMARRRSEFDPLDGERTIAVALTDWVLLNEDGRLVRPPAEIVEVFGQMADFSPMRVNAPDGPDDSATTEIYVRRSDLDPLAHVNNAAYLDYIDEIYLTTSGEQRLPLPRRYRVEFISPAAPAARVTARSWVADDAWWFVLAADDRPSLRALLEISPASWVGG